MRVGSNGIDEKRLSWKPFSGFNTVSKAKVNSENRKHRHRSKQKNDVPRHTFIPYRLPWAFTTSERYRRKKSKTTEKKVCLLLPEISRESMCATAWNDRESASCFLLFYFISLSTKNGKLWCWKHSSAMVLVIQQTTSTHTPRAGKILLYRCRTFRKRLLAFAFNYYGISYLFRLWHTFLRCSCCWY